MKRYHLIPLVLLACQLAAAQPKEPVVRIETVYGTMKIRLYEETPLHRDNFIKLVSEGYYDGQLFHRVIKDFMIQGGDPSSRGADKGVMLGTGGPGYTIPAEVREQYFHKKGALAAARKGDAVNPMKESSGSQFYIVQGQPFTREQLKAFENMGRHKPFSEAQIEAYTTYGGSPHLDGEYTVFGEVVEGLEVLEKISKLPVDAYSRPYEDVVFKMVVEKQAGK